MENDSLVVDFFKGKSKDWHTGNNDPLSHLLNTSADNLLKEFIDDTKFKEIQNFVTHNTNKQLANINLEKVIEILGKDVEHFNKDNVEVALTKLIESMKKAFEQIGPDEKKQINTLLPLITLAASIGVATILSKRK